MGAFTKDFVLRQNFRKLYGLTPMLCNLLLEWIVRKTLKQRNAP